MAALPLTGDANHVSAESQPVAGAILLLLATQLLDEDHYVNDTAKSGKKAGTLVLVETDVTAITVGAVVAGERYEIGVNSAGDFANVGAPDNNLGTRFTAVAGTPTAYNSATLIGKRVVTRAAQGPEKNAAWTLISSATDRLIPV